MRPMDKATADSLSVQSFAISKNSEHRNFVIGRFQTRARNGLFVWDWPVHSRPLSHRQPFFDFFFWREGAAVHRLSETDNPSSNCPSKLTDKVRRIVHSKLGRITYLTQIIKWITHLTHEFSSLVWKRPFLLWWMSFPPALSWAFGCLLLLFHKDYF